MTVCRRRWFVFEWRVYKGRASPVTKGPNMRTIPHLRRRSTTQTVRPNNCGFATDKTVVLSAYKTSTTKWGTMQLYWLQTLYINNSQTPHWDFVRQHHSYILYQYNNSIHRKKHIQYINSIHRKIYIHMNSGNRKFTIIRTNCWSSLSDAKLTTTVTHRCTRLTPDFSQDTYHTWVLRYKLHVLINKLRPHDQLPCHFCQIPDHNVFENCVWFPVSSSFNLGNR